MYGWGFGRERKRCLNRLSRPVVSRAVMAARASAAETCQ